MDWDCPMCDWMGSGGMMGWMGFPMILGMLLGIGLLVLVIVAIVRLLPRRDTTFQSSEPPPEARQTRRPHGDDEE